MALPAEMYRDPMEAAMRAEERSCGNPRPGCKHLEKLLGREFCGVGRRELVKCKKFQLKNVVNCGGGGAR